MGACSIRIAFRVPGFGFKVYIGFMVLEFEQDTRMMREKYLTQSPKDQSSWNRM